MNQFKNFVSDNFKSLIIIFAFLVTMYAQHTANTAHIAELTSRCATLEAKIQDQYEKIDAIKLDKAVFEATMTQFTQMRGDLQEMRADIKELLKNRR